MKLTDFAMIVVSCDAYTELGKIFFDLQQKYMGWLDVPRYFINESKPADFDGVKTIHVGTDVDWSGKMSRALEQIPEKYILFMLEDYFIGKPVAEDHIREAVQTMKKYDLRYYKITPLPPIHKGSFMGKHLAQIPGNMRYGVNLQAAIFEKSYLQQIVSGPDRSAWETETDLLKFVTERFEDYLPGCVLDRRNIIDVHNGVIKGKWVPGTVSYFQRRGYTIDLGQRPMLPHWFMIKMNIMRFVSHILPPVAARNLKAFLKRLGMKFVTDN